MLKELAQYLSDQGIATFDMLDDSNNQIYLGQIDLEKDECLGLYEDIDAEDIRNIDNEKYEEHGVTMLIHWSGNYETARAKADAIYKLFRDTDRFTTENYVFWNFRTVHGQPKYMETRNDIYEFVISYFFKINI